MLVPAGAATFAEALRIGAEIYHALKALLHERGLATGGRRRGRLRARSAVGARPRSRRSSRPPSAPGHRDRVAIALDPATSELFRDGAYHVEGQGRSTRDGLIDLYAVAGRALPDRLDRGRARRGRLGEAGRRSPSGLGDRLQLVGDDLFVTNVERLRRGIARGRRQRDPRQGQPDRHAHRDARRDRARAAERLRDGHLAPLRRDRGHDDRRPRRRDERGQIKTGAPARSDRVAKYNQLLRIEEELGEQRRLSRAGTRSRGSAGSVARRDTSSAAARRSSPRSGPPRSTPGGARRARRGRDGRRAAELLARHARDARRARAPRARGAGGGRPPARADRRPAGAEAPHRRPRRADRRSRSGDEIVVAPRGDGAATATCPVSPAVIGEVLQPGHDVLIDDGHVGCASRRSTRAARSAP